MAKETCNLIDPTNQSNDISVGDQMNLKMHPLLLEKEKKYTTTQPPNSEDGILNSDRDRVDLKMRMLLLEEEKVSAEEDCTEAILEVTNMATAVQGLYLADRQVLANARSGMVAGTCGRVCIFMCIYVCIYIYICMYASHEYGDSVAGTLFGRSAVICKCKFVDGCVHMWKCIYIHVRMCVCMCLYMYICKS